LHQQSWYSARWQCSPLPNWTPVLGGAPISGGLWGAAITLAFGSQMFVLWAMAANPFFAATAW